MTSREMQDALEGSSGTSYWLKRAIAEMNERDVVDAERDSATLAQFCRLRCDEAFKGHQS